MPWTQIQVQTLAENAEELSALLEDQGALAVTLQDAGDQPIYEPELNSIPVWDNTSITGLFDESHDIKKIIASILTKFPNVTYSINQLEEQEWHRTWMQDFLPMQFGDRLWIVPSYEQQESLPCKVILDPGLAFGTGKHPTTELCLRWLDKNIHGGETVIDYGCGSGILGIAALKLGAKKVYAIDHDPQALQATHENADRNGVEQDQLNILYPNEITLEHQADILIANILANPLMELASTFAKHVNKKGRVILSGILSEQLPSVIAVYENIFEIDNVAHQDDWTRIDCTKL